MSVINDAIKLISALPPGVLEAVVDLIKAVVSSEDPKRTAERHAKAIASKAASDAAVRKILG